MAGERGTSTGSKQRLVSAAPPRYARHAVYQDEARRRLQRFLDRSFELRPDDAVLDVGCGFVLPIDVPVDVRLVGLDADEEALAKNVNLDEAIAGDVAELTLAAEEFDMVVCWNVLEHLPNVRAALHNLTHALRTGGVLVVAVPDRSSLKGLITRLTPLSFHVWVYRRVLGSPNAGKPGFGPYRTYLVRDLTPRRFTALAATLGLEAVYEDADAPALPLPRLLRIAWSAAGALGRLVTLGRWDPLESERIFVFRKIEAPRT